MTVIPLKFLALLPLVWGVWLAGFIVEHPGGGLTDAVGTAGAVPAAADTVDDTLQQWRREKIRDIWNRTHRDGTVLTEKRLNAFMRGDFSSLTRCSVKPAAFILSGTPVLELSPAGMLLTGQDGRFWPICSTVLTKPDTVLSAAHCLSSLPADAPLKVYFPYEGIRDVARNGVALPCAGSDASCSADLAVIRLAEPYDLIPLAGYDESVEARPGSPVNTLGFGMTSEILSDNGLLRSGKAALTPCGCKGNSDDTGNSLCFTTAYGDGSTITNGYAALSIDSGAPLFVDSTENYSLKGVARGIEKGCDKPGLMESQYTDISNGAIIAGLSGALCSPDCEWSKNQATEVLLSIDLALTGGPSVQDYALQLDDQVQTLVLTLNHEVNGFRPDPGGDLDLVLQEGSDAVCQRYYGVETCTVNNPGPGVYTIGVRTVSGRPAYQLAAVSIHRDD